MLTKRSDNHFTSVWQATIFASKSRPIALEMRDSTPVGMTEDTEKELVDYEQSDAEIMGN